MYMMEIVFLKFCLEMLLECLEEKIDLEYRKICIKFFRFKC